jgi:3-carboxy-cis,cis-muconate cycloisomerase
LTVFAAIFVPDEVRECVSDSAWVEAMLEVERALATAGATVGVVPESAAAMIAERSRGAAINPEQLAREGRRTGNPVEPLVRALRAEVGGEAAGYVHRGATSQDVMDTAAMLIARCALDVILATLDRAAAACARQVETHRTTPMVARTLLQQAVPTTFGFKAAGWLVGLLDARAALLRVRADGLAAELGGAAGTLAVFGDRGPEALARFAAELGLPEPTLPWHTNRVRVAELGAALAIAAGAAAKIGLDAALLAQSEVAEAAGPGGGSSTMPQKRNPVGSALALACAQNACAAAATLIASLPQEHERAVGAWHAEWDALTSALAFTGGAVAAVADDVEGLTVDPERMHDNLAAADGAVLTERIATRLADQVGAGDAHDLLATIAGHARDRGRPLRDELADDDRVSLTNDELERLLDPTTYLGATGAFADRALERFASERP